MPPAFQDRVLVRLLNQKVFQLVNMKSSKTILASKQLHQFFLLQKLQGKKANYVLKSHLQSSYDLGINYLHHLKNDLIFSTGFHVIIGKRNFL
jgi:sulfur relay (sulfurtransferase) DsrF/TusC family protein